METWKRRVALLSTPFWISHRGIPFMTCMSAEAIVLIMTMQARWICLTWGYVFLSGSDSLLAGLAACESWEVSLHDSPVFASCFGGQRLRAEVTDGSYFVWLYVKFVFKFVWPDKHQCHWGSGWSWKMRRCRAKDVYAHVKPFVAFFYLNYVPFLA